MKNLSFKTLLCASALTLAATNALAGPLEETHIKLDADGVATASVPYLTSELGSEEGRQALNRRISRAAKSVCGSSNSRQAGGLRLASRNKRCYEEAMQIAMGQAEANQIADSGH